MRFAIRLSLLFFVLSMPVLVSGQARFYLPDTTVKVYAYGREQTLAWSGGYNNPQFAMADLNHDGLQDLVIFEPWNSLRTFINVGKEGAPDYRYEPEYEVNFPPVMDYLILADYNCDGISDLFHQGNFGFQVYKGYYNAYNQLAFKYYKDLFYSNDRSEPIPVNGFNNPGDIPAVVDVDGDGDLDFIAYDINGGFMNYFRNARVELGLPCDSIHIDLFDHCWGKVKQGYDRAHALAQTCDNSTLAFPRMANRKTHQGNTPCLFDWDMDGDYDYLDGSISFNEMTFLKNGRKEYNPAGPDSMVSQDTMWQSGGRQIEMPVWAAAFNVDIDQDGKKDLLVSPNGGNLSMNYNNIWFYKNYSTPGVADWRFQSDSFLTDKTIDLGTAAYPVLFDFDKDGKPDLFIGSEGYFRESDGTLRSKMTYYHNTSVTGRPSFTLQTSDFLGLSAQLFKGIAPAFGDIDGDGVADMLLGHSDGTISYYKNLAASDTVAANFHLQQLALTDVTGAIINVGGHAAPFVYDIDHDGKKDLIIGSVYGYIQYYRNVSTVPGVVSLQLVNAKLGKVRADSNINYGANSVPFIGKIDSTGIEYLLVGSNSGNIYQYTGFQSGDTTVVYTLLNAAYSYINSTYSLYQHPGEVAGVYGGHRSAVTVGDIAGNGGYNMLVGDNKGGVNSYVYKKYVAPPISHVGVAEAQEQGSVLLYPNPAKELLMVSWSGVVQPHVQISFINMEGQTLYSTVTEAALNHAALQVDLLPSGMYVCVLQSGVNRYYSKFTVVR